MYIHHIIHVMLYTESSYPFFPLLVEGDVAGVTDTAASSAARILSPPIYMRHTYIYYISVVT